MRFTGLNELRESYLKFFENKNHLRLPSFSLVPKNDPSILLINAGMTPLKPYFTGDAEPPSQRVTTCQKCLRVIDIDNVGRTARHATFFEMLGNFSFADYFKKEAIQWAWEYVTGVLEIDADKLWVTVYIDDDEAHDIWKSIGVSDSRIVRLGKADNFWEHGVGPCGPCSEIYLDRGGLKGCGKADCKPGCDCDRFVEFWNLVFAQYFRDEKGNYTQLKKKNIDTGMGLERLACLMQEVDSIFDVDTIASIIRHISTLSGVDYGGGSRVDSSFRIIADHIRGCVMMASDGILPSNEGRGYIFRRLLRRAARHGKLLGIKDAFLHEIAETVIKESGRAYPEVAGKQDHIKRVLRTEEERFYRTIDIGLGILTDCLNSAKVRGESVLSGSEVFRLHDTYGFPLELTREIAAENGFVLDEAGFAAEMDEQRKRAREALKEKDVSAWGGTGMPAVPSGTPKTEFRGYVSLETEALVLAVIRPASTSGEAIEGEEAIVVLDKTAFYAESGGQVADTGHIHSSTGSMRIDGCKKTPEGIYLHSGVVETGSIRVGDAVKSSVDVKRRQAIARNHSATHLLHRALRDVLGEHVSQSGSLVEPDRLRFDFTHISPVSSEELEKIEKRVNEKIFEGLPVNVQEMPLDEARKTGAMALFDEKYGDIVRVVRMGSYSTELCGGIHIHSTAEAGLMKITAEGSVAAGIRRIEALTGEGALSYLLEREKFVDSAALLLKSAPGDLLRKIESLAAELKENTRELAQMRAKLASQSMEGVLKSAIDVDGVKLVKARYDNLDTDAMRNAADMLKVRLGSGVIVLASAFGGKVSLLVAVTGDLVSKGYNAGILVRELARITGGGGGGRPDMAQAGGRDIKKLDDALAYASVALAQQTKGGPELG